MPTKSAAKEESAKLPKKPRAPRAKKPAVAKHEAEETPVVVAASTETPAISLTVESLPEGKYVFATGRRKTSVANVRLFSGSGKSVVNKKPLSDYFSFDFYREEATKPFEVTGLAEQYHFVANIRGGGIRSQAGALRHGIATALGKLSEEVRKVLKKNGFLTRDDRAKERKKPGLKRARRSPQWAKR